MPKAQHPMAASFVRQNLFAGVTSFTELEARIAALPDEPSRGGAFEVFAEAYLATQRKHDAAKVWPLASVPTTVLQTLGLGRQDFGVDGVFKTLLGHFNAYQVKFRTNRPALTWRELSTFMGLADSPHVRSRVLITNCDEVASVLNERQGFFCIRGSDLDRLEADDFRAIEAWLADAAFVPPKKQPQPHQTEALDALLPALQTHDRVSAIMACGTGKTLVALWVAEHVARASSPASSGGIPAARILVLVPSLALLRQILHEWLRETSLPSLAYLCVCSDPTVKEGIDAIATAQSDLDFQVLTDAKSVRDFLDAPFAGTKIVFSTYQSAQVVGAALKPGEAFDLAVFDEAHKTAGREGRNYAFALEDVNLPIRKRLFLTATPRHYNPHRRDREGDAQLVFSMDRPEVYGPQAFRLTFAEAARRGIICGYKVIISVITTEMVTNELLSRGEVVVNGDAVRARQVANQIALRDAIEKYGVKKIFTFHSTVKSAASFVADSSEGIGSHLADVRSPGLSRSGPPEGGTRNFQSFHVNGTMPTARREREMRDFRSAARAIMSNARCLTEGVDVPAVDMVAFLSPRRSHVDIVQATGRAMRRSPGKTTGYVLVPLYVELAADENVEEAVQRSEFDEVWDVLQAMQDQDDVLAEIIHEMREQRGRLKGFDEARFKEIVDVIGPSIALDVLRRSVTTQCIDWLGDGWDERFGELRAFKGLFGHCNVESRWNQNPRLSAWVGTQRAARKAGSLTEDRRRQLDEIGFVWDLRDLGWEEMFAALVQYRQLCGDCSVPARWRKNPKLAAWVGTQRLVKMAGELETERLKRLEEIGFVWYPSATAWEEMFVELKRYQTEHGDCKVPKQSQDLPRLASWVDNQRQLFRLGRLGGDQIRQLEAIGFDWSPHDSAWEQMFARFAASKHQHSSRRASPSAKEKSQLHAWIAKQRRDRAKRTLNENKIRCLDAEGFIWNPHVAKWEAMFSQLERYKREHGHCDVPSEYSHNPKLGAWLTTQRVAQRSGVLVKSRLERLNQLGVTWDRVPALWDEMFEALTKFHKKAGHCNVPLDSKENPKLGRWVNRQRQLKKRRKLTGARVRQLDDLGFAWDARSVAWERMFAALAGYRRNHRHCNVPAKWPENVKLGKWVDRQRTDNKSGRITPQRVQRLNSIGFQWHRNKNA